MLRFRREANEAAKVDKKKAEAKKPPLTKEVVRERIVEDQWKTIEWRLGRAAAEDGGDGGDDDDDCASAFSKISTAKPQKCLGEISLAIEPQSRYGDKESMTRPMPALREIRARITRLGFRVSADGLWATFVEEDGGEGDLFGESFNK